MQQAVRGRYCCCSDCRWEMTSCRQALAPALCLHARAAATCAAMGLEHNGIAMRVHYTVQWIMRACQLTCLQMPNTLPCSSPKHAHLHRHAQAAAQAWHNHRRWCKHHVGGGRCRKLPRTVQLRLRQGGCERGNRRSEGSDAGRQAAIAGLYPSCQQAHMLRP